ncbi:MAG: NAD(P) transhydrogenase subunit alpha [Clostridia bacterium]|nr:NAD(P) transhydrogenase subunit alpha [Clostridia bacterium]
MNILFSLFGETAPSAAAAPEAAKTVLEHPVWGPVILVAVFIVASVLGYIIIKKVPSLLHTPLMSGMNALSGVTVLGALIAGIVCAGKGQIVMMIIAFAAAALAMINVAGGFAVTHKMLRMFDKKDKEVEK